MPLDGTNCHALQVIITSHRTQTMSVVAIGIQPNIFYIGKVTNLGGQNPVR